MNTDNIKIGGVYSFTNDKNYTTKIRVVRVNDKSVFYTRIDNDTYILRMSLNSFKDFVLTNNI